MKLLQDKVALITGASRGIGRGSHRRSARRTRTAHLRWTKAPGPRVRPSR